VAILSRISADWTARLLQQAGRDVDPRVRIRALDAILKNGREALDPDWIEQVSQRR